MDAKSRIANLRSLEVYRRYDTPLCLLLLSQILSGLWSECITTIGTIRGLEERSKKAAVFLVRRQQFLELVGMPGRLQAAKHVLRNKIYPQNESEIAVQELLRQLHNPKRAIAIESWVPQRLGLFLYLTEVIPSWIYYPGNRSAETLELFLTTQHRPSFMNPTWCEQKEIPSVCIQVEDMGNDGILLVKFSNTGKYLASTSTDCMATIWMIDDNDTISLKYNLVGHGRPILSVEWKSDDTELITCAEGEDAKLWDVDTGTCKLTFCMPMNVRVKACAWSHNPDKIFFGSCKPDNFIYTWNADDNMLQPMYLIPEVSDLVVTPSPRLICVCSDNIIRELGFTGGLKYEMEKKDVIAPVSLSKYGNLLILNVNYEEIHVWNTNTHSLEHKYRVGKQDCILGACFGGSNSSFIASGSKESEIYIWHRLHEMPIKTLSGHTMPVNSVSWNLAKPHMLASGSSDGTIRIWVVSSKCEKQLFASKKQKV
ncbi:WD repeat-containing protein WDS homolog [Typha angustifolia]|uniref:WD repeat-containing protein WDS homolog n=1 Tax=Typha angustifolia TaxID=59011 RepID=UPI003C2E1FC2